MQDLGKPKWTLPKTEYKKLSQSVAKKALPSYKTRWIRDTQIPGFALR